LYSSNAGGEQIVPHSLTSEEPQHVKMKRLFTKAPFPVFSPHPQMAVTVTTAITQQVRMSTTLTNRDIY
jgi:hypothetical protein